MLIAVFTSRSRITPHTRVRSRTFNTTFPANTPQAEHREEGKNRSMVTSSRPYQAALYSDIDRDSVHAAYETARESMWFSTMMRTVRTSTTTTRSWRTSRVEGLCKKSRLRSAIRAYTRAAFMRAPPWLFDHVLAQDRCVPAARSILGHRHRPRLRTLGQRTRPAGVQRLGRRSDLSVAEPEPRPGT